MAKRNLPLIDPTADRVLKGLEVPIHDESESTPRPGQGLEGKRLTFGPEIKRTGRGPERE